MAVGLAVERLPTPFHEFVRSWRDSIRGVEIVLDLHREIGVWEVCVRRTLMKSCPSSVFSFSIAENVLCPRKQGPVLEEQPER